MTGDRMQQAMPWLLGVTIVVFGGIVALVLIGRAYALDHVHEAVENGNVVLVRWFVLVRPEVLEARDARGRTPLHLAADRGHADVAEALLAAGADANAKADDGSTPLHLAAEGGRADVAEALLAAGAAANARDDYGSTPLHRAAWMGHASAADVLLTAGADLHAKADGGRTPLDMACYTPPSTRIGRTAAEQTRRNDVFELLKRHGAQRSDAEDG